MLFLLNPHVTIVNGINQKRVYILSKWIENNAFIIIMNFSCKQNHSFWSVLKQLNWRKPRKFQLMIVFHRKLIKSFGHRSSIIWNRFKRSRNVYLSLVTPINQLTIIFNWINGVTPMRLNSRNSQTNLYPSVGFHERRHIDVIHNHLCRMHINWF